jgi:hypothetical protein
MTDNTVLVVSMIADLVTILAAMSGVFAVLLKRASNEGRITQILSDLQSGYADHETRLRVVETKVR